MGYTDELQGKETYQENNISCLLYKDIDAIKKKMIP